MSKLGQLKAIKNKIVDTTAKVMSAPKVNTEIAKKSMYDDEADTRIMNREMKEGRKKSNLYPAPPVMKVGKRTVKF